MSRAGRATVEVDDLGLVIGHWESTLSCSRDIGVPVPQLYTNIKFGWRTAGRTFAFLDTLADTLDWGRLPVPHGKKCEKIKACG